MLYYSLILLAVLLFGFNFLSNKSFQKQCGSSLTSTMVLTLGSGLFGLLALCLINGFSLHVTPFTFVMAALAALNGIAFSFCSIIALGQINLSLFSVFSMIGGMLLPFLAGILFWQEGMTFPKALCLLLLVVGMSFTVQKGSSRGKVIYYIGVFVFNGMSGVLSMIFNHGSFEKASAADYSILSAIIRIVLALIVLLFLLTGKHPRTEIRSFRKPRVLPLLFFCGVLSTVANYLLLVALEHVPGSMQYPLVTGGVMICSTLLAYLTDKKPGVRDLLAVAFSFLGMLALLLPA